MNKICTSLEQSKKLMELGVDVDTSDMAYHSVENEYGSGAFVAISKVITNGFENDDFYIDDVPCWSLAALLSILTEQDFTIKAIGNEFNIDIPIRHCKIWFPSLLDAAFEMVCWLLENGKI